MFSVSNMVQDELLQYESIYWPAAAKQLLRKRRNSIEKDGNWKLVEQPEEPTNKL